jgi:hypothetical protein
MPQCIIADAENLRCGSCEYIHQLSVRHQSEDERECGCKATNDSEKTTFVAADGQQLRALGSIELAWNFPNPKDGHIKWRHETFNVLPSNHIQVIFGADYCRENEYLHFNEDAIHALEVTPLMPNRKPSNGKLLQVLYAGIAMLTPDSSSKL